MGELFHAGESTGFKIYKKIENPESELTIELRIGNDNGCSIDYKFDHT